MGVSSKLSHRTNDALITLITETISKVLGDVCWGLGTNTKYFFFLLYCKLLWRNEAEREEQVKQENLFNLEHLTFELPKVFISINSQKEVNESGV